MHFNRQMFVALAATLLVIGSAVADKDSELREKAWSIRHVGELGGTRADVFETEPANNICPGEGYTLLNVYHAYLTPSDNDWIHFECEAGDPITIGTDADPAGGPSTDTNIQLYASDCSTLLASDDNSHPGGVFSLISNFPAPYTGTYAVIVRGTGPVTGPYILIANCTAPVSVDDSSWGSIKALYR